MSRNFLGALIDKWVPRVRQAFTDSVADLRDRMHTVFVGDQLALAGAEAAIGAVGLDPAALRPLDQAIALAFEAGGNEAAGEFPGRREPDGELIQIRFNVRDFAAEAWARDHSATLVREILDDQRTAIRNHIVAGLQVGRSPRDIARDLVGRVSPQTGRREGGIIGLTASQEEWSRNYADELARGDRAALSRALRDKRFDTMVEQAISSGTPLPAETVTKIVAAYRNRSLRYRAETLALAETHSAVEEGRYQAVEQAIRARQFDPAQVTKTWRDTGDRHVRHTHERLGGQTVSFRAEFISPSGARLRFPGDPKAPAAERVGCRCWMETRFRAPR